MLKLHIENKSLYILKVATPHGLEPRSRILETPILPLNYGVINLVRSEGFEPPTLTFVASCSKSNWSYKRIGGNGWIRTTDCRRMKAVLYQLNYVTVKWSEWLDSNQRPPGSKPGRLPTDLHSEYWCSHTESNCEWRITKPQLYHLTIGAKNLVEVLGFEPSCVLLAKQVVTPSNPYPHLSLIY